MNGKRREGKRRAQKRWAKRYSNRTDMELLGGAMGRLGRLGWLQGGQCTKRNKDKVQYKYVL